MEPTAALVTVRQIIALETTQAYLAAKKSGMSPSGRQARQSIQVM
jgi:hypothetical protein